MAVNAAFSVPNSIFKLSFSTDKSVLFAICFIFNLRSYFSRNFEKSCFFIFSFTFCSICVLYLILSLFDLFIFIFKIGIFPSVYIPNYCSVIWIKMCVFFFAKCVIL